MNSLLKASMIFATVGCALPTLTLPDEIPSAIKEQLGAMNKRLATIEERRDRAKAMLQDLVVGLAGKFELKALDAVKKCRLDMLKILQEEVDLHSEFKTWSEACGAAIGELLADAMKARGEAAAAVRTQILQAGFDDQAKAQADQADSIVAIHPTVCAASERIELLGAMQRDTLPRALTDSQFRMSDLKAAVADETRCLLVSEGLERTVKYAYQHGADCADFLELKDR